MNNIIVDNSDVVGASPVGTAPTTSSLSTSHPVSMDWAQAAARRDEKHFSFGIWCVLYYRMHGLYRYRYNVVLFQWHKLLFCRMSDRTSACVVFNVRALVTHCAAVVSVSRHRRCKPRKATKTILVWIESFSYSVVLSLLGLILTNQSIYWFLLDDQYCYHVNFVIISFSGAL